MLSVNNITKTYGIETILAGVSFNLNAGERLALVGPNGCGKTTLIRILTGEQRADSGNFHFAPPGLRVGYLPQGFAFCDSDTIGAFLDRMEGDLPSLEARIGELALQISAQPDDPGLQHDYDETLSRLTLAAENAGNTADVLSGLGLGDIDRGMPVNMLSGGQKTRLALAGVLLSSPELLLLDEPTNHLDLDMLAWLEDWLINYPSRTPMGVLIVSHDRAFLDQVATGVLEIDPATHKLREFPGNYTAYLEQKLAEREKLSQAYADQQVEIRRMRQDINRAKQQSSWVEQTTTPRQPGVRRIAKKVARKALAREKKLERYLDSDERVEKPVLGWQMKLEFQDTPESGVIVATLDRLSVGYDGIPLLKTMSLTIRQGARVALIGPNGAGKTTLVRTIAGKLEPVEGTVRLGANVKAGYMAQEQEDLDPDINALETIQRIYSQSETEARNFLHYFLFAGDDVFTPVGKLSYGERSRLSLACLVAQGCNLLLLDEPLNHLDIPSRARFEQALGKFEGTILAVVHDRYFIEGFAKEVWEVRDGEVRQYIR